MSDHEPALPESLQRRRPLPSASFVERVRRQLTAAERDAAHRVHVLIASFAVVGVALLIIGLALAR